MSPQSGSPPPPFSPPCTWPAAPSADSCCRASPRARTRPALPPSVSRSALRTEALALLLRRRLPRLSLSCPRALQRPRLLIPLELRGKVGGGERVRFGGGATQAPRPSNYQPPLRGLRRCRGPRRCRVAGSAAGHHEMSAVDYKPTVLLRSPIPGAPPTMPSTVANFCRGWSTKTRANLSTTVSGLLSCRCGSRAEDHDEDDADAPTVASKERKKVACVHIWQAATS